MEKAANINCGLPNCIKEVPAKASNAIQASALASVSDGTGALRLSSTATAPESWAAAFFAHSMLSASMMSATASAELSSMRPLRKARFVNSPGRA